MAETITVPYNIPHTVKKELRGQIQQIYIPKCTDREMRSKTHCQKYVFQKRMKQIMTILLWELYNAPHLYNIKLKRDNKRERGLTNIVNIA